MNIRGLHFDMKAMIPKAEFLPCLLENIAQCGYNALLLELEDKFPFRCCPEAVHPAAYRREDFREMNRICRKLGITVIPLLQSVGHLDYLLKHPQYRFLREDNSVYQWCLSDSRSWEIWRAMAEELLEVFPDCTYFHIGADEAEMPGECPRCAGKDCFQLYRGRVEACADWVLSHGRKPVMWDDVFRNHELEIQQSLLEKVIPCVWLYREMNAPLIRKYASLGIEFWGASCIQANYRYRGMGPQEPKQRNVDDWADIQAVTPQLTGHIGTIWGRIQSMSPQESNLPQSMYMIAYQGETLLHGKIADRSAFNRRFAEQFFGLPQLDMNRIVSGFCNDPDRVKAELEKWLDQPCRNADILRIWHMFNEVDVLYRYIDMCFSSNDALLSRYRRNRAPDKMIRNWRDGVRITEERTAELCGRIDEVLGRYFPSVQLAEYKDERFTSMLEQNRRWGKLLAETRQDF